MGGPTPPHVYKLKSLPNVNLYKMSSLQVMFLLLCYDFHWISITSEAACFLIYKGKISGRYSFLESLKLDLSCSMSFFSLLLASPKCVQNWIICCLHFSALLKWLFLCVGSYSNQGLQATQAQLQFPIAPQLDCHKGSPCHKMFTLPKKNAAVGPRKIFTTSLQANVSIQWCGGQGMPFYREKVCFPDPARSAGLGPNALKLFSWSKRQPTNRSVYIQ